MLRGAQGKWPPVDGQGRKRPCIYRHLKYRMMECGGNNTSELKKNRAETRREVMMSADIACISRVEELLLIYR